MCVFFALDSESITSNSNEFVQRNAITVWLGSRTNQKGSKFDINIENRMHDGVGLKKEKNVSAVG